MGPLWHSAVGSGTVASILEDAVDGPRHRFSQNFVGREDLTKTPDALRRAHASRDANVVPRAAAAVFRPARCDSPRPARRPGIPVYAPVATTRRTTNPVRSPDLAAASGATGPQFNSRHTEIPRASLAATNTTAKNMEIGARVALAHAATHRLPAPLARLLGQVISSRGRDAGDERTRRARYFAPRDPRFADPARAGPADCETRGRGPAPPRASHMAATRRLAHPSSVAPMIEETRMRMRGCEDARRRTR